ncbi:MAG TPA: MATE family efflux transporter [Kiritimatiellia bacterium]|nr:MATE family efflux transporter [Kiritimatiellia bacterium]
MSESQPLLTEPIPRMMRSIALPASIGYLFNTLYNIVDSWFAGRISTDALGALGLSFPIFFAVIAVASGLSTGVSALIANAIGSGQHQGARQLATKAVTFALLTSALVAIGGILATPWMFRWLGAAPEPARLGTQYMTIIFGGSVFFNLNHIFNSFLVVRGDTQTYRNVLMTGVALNMILNPWFIHGGFGIPAMGFKGIAISTVLIQCMAAFYMYTRAWKRGAMTEWTRKTMHLTRDAAIEITRQSVPAMLNMMTIGIGILVLTYFVNEYGTAAIAAYGIATRIEQIILLPAIGLNMAVLALVGQNNGAGRHDRARESVLVALRFGLLVLAPAILLMLVWPRYALSLFTNDAEVIAIGSNYLRVAAFLTYAYVLLFTLTAALQAIKRPMYAVWIGLYRQIIAPVIIIYTLSRLTGLGLWSVWISVAITTWSSALYTLWYANRIAKPENPD